MARTSNQLWNREQAVAVLSLYCQIPFGKMHSRNPAVVQIATHIGRTPSAVALKLVNFASLDPNHQKRGVKGMGNVSALDRQVWADYYGHWEQLADAAVLDTSDADPALDVPQNTEVTATVKIRRGQAFFRRTVFAAYSNQCCITGISNPQLLRASHIVPWAADETYRLDPANGLPLNALHDAAFDRGYMTLDPDHRLVLSPCLRSSVPDAAYHTFFADYESKPITLPNRFAPSQDHLEYHRQHIFRN